MTENTYRARLRETTRTDWRFLLGIARDAVVVDAQTADGCLARALAPWVGAVHHLPPRFHGSDGVSGRRGLPGVEPMASVLPPPAGADWVFLAGASPGDAAVQDVLQHALGLLRPGGRVVVMLENRWGLHWLADWRQASGRPGAHTTVASGSLRAVQRQLWNAGVTDLQGFALLPHHDAPRAIVPISPPCPAAAQKHALDQVWQRASPAAALVRKLLGALIDTGLMRMLYPHYLVTGRKPC